MRPPEELWAALAILCCGLHLAIGQQTSESPGDNVCERLFGPSRAKLVVDDLTLLAVQGNVQAVADCATSGGEILFATEAVVLQETLSIRKPISIGGSPGNNGSSTPGVRIECGSKEAGVEIRSGGVSFTNLSIEGCQLNGSSIIDILPGSNVTMENVQFTNNSNVDGPGCVSVTGAFLEVKNCSFVSCNGTTGGAIGGKGKSTVVVSSSEFVDNFAIMGGAIEGRNSSVTAVNTTFNGNRAKDKGGAIHIQDHSRIVGSHTMLFGLKDDVKFGRLDIEDSLFRDNLVILEQKNGSDQQSGGAVAVTGRTAECEVLRSEFENNSAPISGGAIWLGNASAIVISDSNFTANTALHGGGFAIWAFHDAKINTTVVVEGCQFNSNWARDHPSGPPAGGAGIIWGSVSSKIQHCTFSNNTVPSFAGGALYVENVQEVVLLDSKFTKNSAASGGGAVYAIAHDYPSRWVVGDTRFSQNNVERNLGIGGAVLVEGWGVTFNATHNVLFANNAAGAGGAVYGSNESALMFGHATRLLKNRASFSGGAITVNNVSTLLVTGGVFDQNVARLSMDQAEGSAALGGAVNAYDSSATFINTEFSKCTADMGGAVHLSGQDAAEFRDCAFRKNHANLIGGAILAINVAHVAVERGFFLENKAEQFGGGMWVLESNATFTRSNFTQNLAGTGGGAVMLTGRNGTSEVSMFEMTFLQNEVKGAKAFGGATYFTGISASASIVNSTFVGNKAGEGGGAVAVTGGPAVSLIGATISNNVAKIAGGGIYVASLGAPTNLTVVASTFEGNEGAKSGGGVRLVGSGIVCNISGGTDFTGNYAATGGAVSAAKADGDFNNITLSLQETQTRNQTTEAGILVVLEEFSCMDNVAVDHGSCLVAWGCSVQLFGATMINNTVSSGGGTINAVDATMLIESAVVAHNKVFVSGGGALLTSSIVRMKHSRFDYNKAGMAGGSLAVFDRSVVDVAQCDFIGNNAESLGGAIYVEQNVKAVFNFHTDEISDVAIRWCNFINNTAGSLLEGQSRQFVRSLEGEGGAIAVSGPTTNCTIKNSKIERNSAGIGGGLSWREGAVLSMADVQFVRNEALIGGGLHVEMDDAALMRFDAENLRLDGNSAQEGGGMSLSSKQNLFRDMSNVDFYEERHMLTFLHLACVNNTAVDQGGALEVKNLLMLCADCLFTHNKAGKDKGNGTQATRGGAVYVGDSGMVHITDGRFEGNSADMGGAVYARNGFLESVQTLFMRNHAKDTGGGVCVASDAASTTKDGLLGKFTSCEFRGNEARKGGAMHVIVGRNNFASADCLQLANENRLAGMDQQDIFTLMYKCNSLSTFALLLQSRHLLLTNSTMFDNRALESGSAIFSNNPSLITFCCNPDCEKGGGELTNETFVTYCPEHLRESREETQPVGVGPWAVASMVSTVEIHPHTILAHTSGTELEAVNVTLRDALGQVVPKENVTLVVASKEPGIIAGNPTTGVLIQEGQSTVSGIVLRAKPGSYELEFVFSSQLLGVEKLVAEVTVVVRGCKIGEIEHEEGLSCFECKRRSYSFDPYGDCTSCPDNADCNGSTLTPDNGYWHSSSQSVSIYSCIFPDACAYTGRQEVLSEKAMLAHDQGQRLVLDNELYPQCANGYAGALCASCQENYGKVRSSKCQKCPDKAVSMCVFAVALLCVGLLMFFLLRNILSQAQKIGGSKSKDEDRPQRSPSLSEERCEEGMELVRIPPTVVAMVTGDVESLREAEAKREEERRAAQLGATGRLDTNKSTELLKILVNFLQVIGTAAAVNSRWTSGAIGVITALGFVAGTSDGIGFLSLECVFAVTRLPRSIKASLLYVLHPFALLALFGLFWVAQTFRKRRNMRYLKQRLVVTILVVFYTAYIGMTKRLVRLLYCIKVDLEDGDADESLARFLWVEDTSVTCYEGYHAALVGVVGAPLLLLVSIGYPLGLIIKLASNKELLNDPDFVLKYGFLYKAYRDEYIFWEAIVIARKALLATISVFVRPLGAERQGMLAFGLLVIALQLHTQFRPYRGSMDALHGVEACSLVVSMIVFFCGFLFGTSSESTALDVSLSVLMILSIVCFIAYWVCQLVTAGFEQLEDWLREHGLQQGTAIENLKAGCGLVKHKVETGLQNLL